MLNQHLFNYIISVLLRLSTVLSGLIIFAVSSYLYGPEGRGEIAVVLSFYVSLGLFLSFGLGRIVYQDISLNLDLAPVLQKVVCRYINFCTIFIIVIISVLLILRILGIVTISKSLLIYFLLMTGYFTLCIWQQFSNYFYSAIQKTKDQEKIILITRFIQAVVFLLMIPIGIDIKKFFMIYGSSSFMIYLLEVRGVSTNFCSSHKITFQSAVNVFAELISRAKWAMLEAFSIGLGMLVPFVLGFYVSKEALGNFNFSYLIINAFYFPFSVSMIKLQEKLAVRKELSVTKLIIKKFLIASFFGGVLMTALVFCFVLICNYFEFKRFVLVVPMLKLLSGTLLLASIQMCLQGVWVGTHRLAFSAKLNFLMGIAMIGTVVVASPLFGVFSGVLSIYVAYVLSLVIGIPYLFLIKGDS